jgi:hypothetical protein
LDENILRRIEPTGEVQRIVSAQAGVLNSLLRDDRLMRMSEYAEEMGTGKGYTPLELLADVRAGIFSELAGGRSIDVYRRSLQRAYVDLLDRKINPPPPNPNAAARAFGGAQRPQLDPKLSDIYASVRADLKALDAQIQSAMPRTSGMTRAHLDDLRHRIAKALNPEG